MNDTPDIMKFAFTLVPTHKPEALHEHIRSAVARNLPVVRGVSPPNDLTLSIVGGGPSLADNHGFEGMIAAMNGSLGYLLSRGVVPHMCGVCDPSPHMADIVEAHPEVTYFLASTVHPSVYDKLLSAGCTVYRWNLTSVPGAEAVLDQIEPDWHEIGGGSTMGLRWIALGYNLGFRRFHLHGMDSSFRGKGTHAYPDRQDAKTDWIEFDGYPTRVNFIGQVADFIMWLDRLKQPDIDPVSIKVFGTGLLQEKFRLWKEKNPGVHEGGPKPRLVTDEFRWPIYDKAGRVAILSEVQFLPEFMRHVDRRRLAVQAGGNVGVYPAHLARYFEYVHTFEPDEANYQCLVQNVGRSAGNIRAYHAALGATDGRVGTERTRPKNCGAVRIIPGDAVPMTTIDAMGLPYCDLIMLDAEGYESEILFGAEETIARHKPAVIIEELAGHPMAAVARGGLVEQGYRPILTLGNDTLFLC